MQSSKNYWNWFSWWLIGLWLFRYFYNPPPSFYPINQLITKHPGTDKIIFYIKKNVACYAKRLFLNKTNSTHLNSQRTFWLSTFICFPSIPLYLKTYIKLSKFNINHTPERYQNSKLEEVASWNDISPISPKAFLPQILVWEH